MDINCGKRYIDITFDRNDPGTAYICGVGIKLLAIKYMLLLLVVVATI